VIRVSVVATGIEQAAVARSLTNSAAAPATAAAPSQPEKQARRSHRPLRADMRAFAERAQKHETSAPAHAPAAPQRAPSNVERAALAAIAAAVPPTHRRLPRRCSKLPTVTSPCGRSRKSRRCFRTIRTLPGAIRACDAGKLYPAGCRAAAVPRPAHAEIRGTADAGPGRDSPGPRRDGRGAAEVQASLLQRLASVGLGRRDEETEPPIAARASGPSMAPLPPLPERKRRER